MPAKVQLAVFLHSCSLKKQNIAGEKYKTVVCYDHKFQIGSYSCGCNQNIDNNQNRVPRNKSSFLIERKKSPLDLTENIVSLMTSECSFWCIMCLLAFNLYSFQLEGLIELLTWSLISFHFYFKYFHLLLF